MCEIVKCEKFSLRGTVDSLCAYPEESGTFYARGYFTGFYYLVF